MTQLWYLRRQVDRFDRQEPIYLIFSCPDTGDRKTRQPFLLWHGALRGGQYQNMILELNASDDRGSGFVEQQIQDFASAPRVCGRYCFEFCFLLRSIFLSNAVGRPSGLLILFCF
ncbi:hypothetical protein HPP92_019331 [Vanilla planifolia]|uniref:Uncharacterized protein n=1 Tax=Vanilla planifolia TaxID=51239 RepID=A0A835Q5H0_VANPL|nr:hypothetical protein HPP92_019331 [Vanilla planifolia]